MLANTRKQTDLELLEEITDQTRLTARVVAGAVRATILYNPSRLMAAPADMSTLNTKRFNRDLEYLERSFKPLAVNVVQDFLNGDARNAIVPELYVIHRMEYEMDMVSHVLDMFVRRFRKHRVSSIDMPPFVSSVNTITDILFSISMRLSRFATVFRPALQLWSDSVITSPEPESDSDGASEKRWAIFRECLPGFKAPGDAYPALEKVAAEHAENPYLLELIRTDEAIYTILVLLILLYDGIPRMDPIWTDYDPTLSREDFGVSEGEAGWSGGDGLMNAMRRLNYASAKMAASAERLLANEKQHTDYSIYPTLANALWLWGGSAISSGNV